MKKTLLTFLGILLLALSSQAQTVLNFTATPQQPVITTVTTSGAQGTTSYCYWVVAIYPGGNSSPAGPICTNLANATLSSTNFNIISFLAPTGPLTAPTGYDILRTGTITPPTGACACAVATNQSGSPINDQSNSLSGYSVNTASTNMQLYLDNSTSTVPKLTVKGSTGVATGFIDNSGALNTGGTGQSPVLAVYGNATTAQVNAGLTIVPDVAGRTIKVLHVLLQALGGATATCTSVNINDTAAVVAVAQPIASLTQNTIVTEASANAVLTTFQAALTAGKGLQIAKVGSSCATATSFNYGVLYTYQ